MGCAGKSDSGSEEQKLEQFGEKIAVAAKLIKKFAAGVNKREAVKPFDVLAETMIPDRDYELEMNAR